MEEPQKEKNRKNHPNKGLRDYARYSGIVIQMIVIILISTWGGTRLDKLAGFSTPIFTIILSLLGVFAAIYIAIKDFLK